MRLLPIIAILQMLLSPVLVCCEDADASAHDLDIHPAYDHLDAQERVCYEEIREAILQYSHDFVVDAPNPSEYRYVMDAFRSDYPEYFWASYCRVQSYSSVCRITADYDDLDVQSRYADLMEAIKDVRFEGSEGDRIRDAHNWVISRCEYNMTTPDCDNAYGAIILHHAKCDGFAYAMNLICRINGISSQILSGYIESERQFHAWNVIKCDGKWYHTDVTWDNSPFIDPVHNYGYFLVGQHKVDGSREIFETYVPVGDISWDDCPYDPYTTSERIIFFSVLAAIAATIIAYAIYRHQENVKYRDIYLEKKRLREEEERKKREMGIRST